MDDVASILCQALGRGGGLHRPRLLVLVPGKLLVMSTSRSSVPLAALSLAEGARVGVRVRDGDGTGAANSAGRYTTSNKAWEAVAEAEEGARLAFLEVTVRGRRHVFRMPSTSAARAWHEALDAAMHTHAPPPPPPPPPPRSAPAQIPGLQDLESPAPPRSVPLQFSKHPQVQDLVSPHRPQIVPVQRQPLHALLEPMQAEAGG